MSKKITYICDWLPPDFGAVGQYSVGFARDYANEGHQVNLVGLTSGEASFSQEVLGDGELNTIKIHARTYNKQSFISRMAWTVVTNVRLLKAAWKSMRRADEIIFTGSPPLLIHFIMPLSFLFRGRMIYRITDFYPECLMAAKGSNSLWLKLLYRVTVFWRKRVDQFQALGEDQKNRLVAIGIDEQSIVIKRDPSPVEITPDTQPLARPEGSGDKVLLLYSGNWGVAHDIDTFVNAYRQHCSAGSGRVLLWLNAVGAGAVEVRKRLSEAGLPFIDGNLVPLDELANLLVTPDAHLITLFDEFVGYVLPSKVYGCVASQKPVVYVGSQGSDVHLVCKQGLGDENYYQVEVGEQARLEQALETLADRVEKDRQESSAGEKLKLRRKFKS